ncbi:MAG: CD1375 family protein [Candidatus Cloacimonetes bacterium]|nr:CD1375 family protein [Candidatus Cloacimonadota bacterium]
MAKIYADLIRKGLKTIDEVPERIRAEVQSILDSDSIA